VKQKKELIKKPCMRMILETKSNQNQEEAKMKQIRVSFKMLSVMSLLALTVGCTTTSSTQNKESMLVASGFKVITPKTTAQQQKLQNDSMND